MVVAAHGQSQPRFRSGVEVTSLDVTVVDNRGRPIPDLTPAEFTVRVDGAARRVVSAEWVPLTSVVTAGRPNLPPSPEGYSSNESTSGGRLILIVIDQPNIRPGGAVGHRAAINTFIDRLQPSDRVGVINLGLGARSVSFTTDRDRAKQLVSTSVGGVPYPPSNKTAGEQTFDTLRMLLTALQPIDAPKTLVLVSQGFVFADHARPSFDELERVAASARTTIYALRLDERVPDIMQEQPDARLGPTLTEPPASARGGAARSQSPPDVLLPPGPIGDRGPDGMDAAGELYNVAAATGGSVFTVAMTADAALAQIESELSGYYVLGVESHAADGDRKPHSLTVDVGRPGVTVRSKRSLPGRVQETPAGASPDPVAVALASPLMLSALRLRVATASSRDDDPSQVRLLIRAQVGTDYRSPQRVTLGFIIIDRDGTIVQSRSGSARLQPVNAGVPSPLQFSGSASLRPGEYTLKLAVAEGDRIGSVEHPIRATLTR
jgi:VWFA-related protein